MAEMGQGSVRLSDSGLECVFQCVEGAAGLPGSRLLHAEGAHPSSRYIAHHARKRPACTHTRTANLLGAPARIVRRADTRGSSRNGTSGNGKAFTLVEAAAKGPPEDEATVTKTIRENIGLFRRNFPLQAAMEISTDPAKLHALDRMTWWIRKWDSDVILIGDRPLLTYPRQKYPCGIPLDSRDCLIVLPIAPNSVFFACANPKVQTKMRRMMLSRLANLVNQEAILRATCVYATDGSHAEFIAPRLEGKILGTWHP